MSITAFALPLLLLLAPEGDDNFINPDEARVVRAAKSPEALWAFLIDPGTRYDDRMLAAQQAGEVLPARYVPKVIAAQLALEDESVYHKWWLTRKVFESTAPVVQARRQVLGFDWTPPAEPLDYPVTLADLRTSPWPWQVQRALNQVKIPIASAEMMDVVRDLPCSTQKEEWVIERTLRRAPMTAEGYGVIRNLHAPRKEFFLEQFLPQGWTFERGDDWNAAQALIVEMAPANEQTGAMMVTEPIATTSMMLFDLTRMIRQMRAVDERFPYTAFLALAHRIDDAAAQDADSRLAYDAARLMQVLDEPLIGEDPARFRSQEACAKWLADFHEWLRTETGDIEAGAAREAAAVADARTRMAGITLCRH